MKILLDENVPKVLKKHLGKSYPIFTAREMNGKKNGELLGLMIANDFDAMITADKNLHYQQNLKRFPIAVFMLDVKFVRPDSIKALAPSIIIALKSKPGIGITIIK